MNYLIDAHTLIWALDDPSKLGHDAVVALQAPENEIYLSAGTIWEISIKAGLGKLSLSLPFRAWMEKAMTDLGLIILPITLDHSDHQARLPFHHRDPFDRLLASQSLIEGMPLISADVVFDQYRVNRIWN